MAKETYIVGVDGSDCARRAASFAAKRARKTEAKLLLVGVVEWSRYAFYTPEELETRRRDRNQEVDKITLEVLEPLADTFTGQGLEVACLVRHGHAAEVLKDLAEETNAVQIFIGRQGRSSFGDALFGGVTNRVLSIAPVPVTVVP